MCIKGPVKLSPVTPGLQEVKFDTDKSTSRSLSSLCLVVPAASHLAVFRPQAVLISNLLHGVCSKGVSLPLYPSQVVLWPTVPQIHTAGS